MTAIVGLLFLLAAVPQGGIARIIFREHGTTLLRQARYEEAERVFRAWEAADPNDTDAVYYRALSLALRGRALDARAGFFEVLARGPRRPDACFEIAATFLQTQGYDQMLDWALRGLRLSPQDEYGLDLAGTAAYLAGDRIPALKYWNQIGRPTLTDIRITAVDVSRQTVAAEIDLKPGDLLSWQAIERARWKLGQHEYLTTTFDPVPGSTPNEYSLDVSVRGKRGLGSPSEVLFTGLSELGFRTARANYWNIAGSGLSVSGGWRWTPAARHTQVSLSVPRLLHVPIYGAVFLAARDESWDFGAERPGLRLRLSEFGLRKTIPLNVPNLTLTVGLVGARRRTGLLDGSAAPQTDEMDPLHRDLGVRRTGWLLTEARMTWPPERVRGGWNIKPTIKVGADGGWAKGRSDNRYGRFTIGTDLRIDRTTFGWRGLVVSAAGHAGAISQPALLEDHFVLGVGPDADYLLRAHPIMKNGKPGSAPLAGAFALANVTTTSDLVRWSWFKLGVTAFLDSARVTRAHPAQGSGTCYLDGGFGIEIGASVLATRRISVLWGRDLRRGGSVVYFIASNR